MSSSVSRRRLLAASLPLLARALPLDDIQLGVTTDEIDEDVAAAAKFLQDFHLKWAEVRSIWGRYNTAQPVPRVREARSIFDAHGIAISIADTAFFRGPLPPPGGAGERILDEQWALLASAIERAKILGTRRLRIFAFTYKNGDTPSDDDCARIWELLGEAGRRARLQGFQLAVENLFGSYVVTSTHAADLLKHVKEDNVGLTWDPNNAAQAGDHPFPDGYGRLDPARIFHVHLRDYRHNAEGKVEWCAVGDGEFDNTGQIRALRRDGYRGSFTLETHWRSPKGKAFSTETSLRALLKVIDRV